MTGRKQYGRLVPKYGGSDYRQSRPKYGKGEPKTHRAAKERVVTILNDMGYTCVTGDHPSQEWSTPPLDYLGKPTPFPIDIYATFLDQEEILDTVLVQIDGAYHYENENKCKKTALRNIVIGKYCDDVGYRYKCLLVEEAQQMPDGWISSKLAPP